MKRGMWIVAAAAAVAGSAVARAEVSFTVVPWSAPNASGSPSWNQAAQNAIHAMQNGLATYGSGAAEFSAISNGGSLPISHNIVTGFNSWDGVAAPNIPSYSGEYGNRLHFAFDIISGQPISVSQLGFKLVDSNTATGADGPLSLPSTDYPTFGEVGSYGYSNQLIGINYGPDGRRGTADDVVVTSGVSTQLVNELIGRGSGNAWAVYTSDPGNTLQDKINTAVADLGKNGPFTVTGTYYLGDASTSGSAVVNMVPVPLPSSAWGGLGLMGVLGAVVGIKRLRKQPV